MRGCTLCIRRCVCRAVGTASPSDYGTAFFRSRVMISKICEFKNSSHRLRFPPELFVVLPSSLLGRPVDVVVKEYA